MIHNALKKLIYAFAIVAASASCGESNNKLQGYEWLEGEWSGAAVQQIFVNITPQYYQVAGEMWDDEMDVAKAEKNSYSIKILHNATLGDLKGICDGEDSATIYIDESKQSIFWIYDFDQKMYLSKSQANDYKGADNSDGEVPDGMWRLSTFSGQMSSGEKNYNIELDISYPSDGEYGCPIKGRYGYAGNTDKISLEGEWMAATPTGNGLTIRLYSDEYKECFDLEYDGTDLHSTRTLEGTWSQYTNESDYSIETDPQKTLKVVLSEESTSWTNPSTPFVEYTLEPQYSWLIGSWTDGSDVISITEKDITVKRGKYVVDSGLYFIDWRGDINVQWKTGRFQDGLCLGENALAIEGGDWLIKLPEMEGGAISGSDIISALTESSKPYEGDISWVYGLWKVPDSKAEIFITPKYCQARGENDSYLDGKGIQKLAKQEYTITEDNNKLLGTVIRLGDYYLDPSSKLLYSLSGLDTKTYLEQTEKYVAPAIKYGKWALLGLLALAAAVFLVIFLIKLIKKMIVALKKWFKKTKEKATVKAKDAKEKASAFGQKAKEKASAFGEKAKSVAANVSEIAGTKVKELGGQAKNAAKNLAQNIDNMQENGTVGGMDVSKIAKWAGIALVVLLFIMVPKWCSNSGESSKDTTSVRKEKTEHKDYRWLEGTWVNNKNVLIQFKASGDDYGTYTIGATFTKLVEIGNYSIDGNTIRMRSAETGMTDCLTIEGRRIRDVDGTYYSKM